MMFSDIGPATGLIEGESVRPLGNSRPGRGIRCFPRSRRSMKRACRGYDALSWQGMAAPAQSAPRPVLDKLNAEITAALAMPDVREQILKYGFLPLANPNVDALEDVREIGNRALEQGRERRRHRRLAMKLKTTEDSHAGSSRCNAGGHRGVRGNAARTPRRRTIPRAR